MARAWVREMQRLAATVVRREREFLEQRKRYQRAHRDLSRLRSDAAEIGAEVNEATLAEDVVYATVNAPISPESWERLVEHHAAGLELGVVVMHFLPLLCETCQTNIEAAGLVSSGGESAFAAALDGFLNWLERFKHPEGRRNALFMLQALPERRASLTLSTTEFSESTIDNGAMRVGSNPPKQAEK